MNDAPECWGQFKADCACEYSEACRLFTETEPAMNRPMYGQDYDAVGEWAPDLADYGHIPGCEPEEPEAATAAPDLAGFLNFILHLDDYTLGILAELIAPSREAKRYTVADLARLHGISRQGMHRKVLSVARKSPELRSLLGMSVRKIRKARREFTAPREARRPSGQMEFRF